jgi:hypothetical protein
MHWQARRCGIMHVANWQFDESLLFHRRRPMICVGFDLPRAGP